MARDPHIDFIEAKERKLRCACGHARSSHRPCAHKHYELGACKAPLAPGNGADALRDEYRCSCTEYRPVRPGGAA